MERPQNHQPIYLTPSEVAARRRCTTGHLANERSAGRGLPFYKIGGASILYAADEVEAFIQSCRVQPVSA